MAGRGGIRAPYSAVLALAAWAADNWGVLDGRLAQSGVDPWTLPAHRLLNVVYVFVVEAIGDEDKRQEVVAALEWPEVQAMRDLEASDRQARAAMASLGLSLPMTFGPVEDA